MATDIVALPGATSIVDAARAMRDANVGDVLVVEQDVLHGIVTDRDIAIRVLAERADPNETTIGGICSEAIAVVTPVTPFDEAINLMRGRAVRRLPVVDENGRPLGVVSLGDLALARDPESLLAEISMAPATR
ncbi:CBS domain-containing protein [Actinobacteria bacterium YIM 96077]|uniref:CBS domain-containing protein n=2 Tax=Phytoactinopolyspora halophila TaxID=1981511 RepID=A0A329QR23_9ACTN|nr:CBS domain-containing protein [Actinobacteria bacterium YIM 96077]RAW14129.1 CBS domain-containing protein [Phytoactinopolyspora halophila]